MDDKELFKRLKKLRAKIVEDERRGIQLLQVDKIFPEFDFYDDKKE